jgi:HAMP domain-containing protein
VSATSESDWLWWLLAAGVAVAAILFLWVWLKGRPFATGDVFRASRLSSGNHLFPTQVLITPTAVVQYTPRWFGRREETIHMAHIASVKIETGMMLSDVFIETSGGTDPIACHGHRKGDAAQMKVLIERYQTDYYRGGPPSPVGGTSTGR